VKDFSAVGYQYAKLLQEKLKVPVGVIMSVWGGTMIEAWMDSASLKAFPEVLQPADTAKIAKNDPSVLYNAMINPFIGYGIKGVIWYQGEQNRINYQIYDRLMAGDGETMAKGLANGGMAFLLCPDSALYLHR